MSIVLQSSSGGSVTINEPTTASNFTQTLPAVTGDIVVSGTTPTLNGITFPATQVPSADANTLDDYEEGTWTPVLNAETTNPTVTYDAQIGTYTKIGRMVMIQLYLGTSARTGGSGNVRISGLPFTAANNSASYCGVMASQCGNLTGATNLGVRPYANQSYLNCFTNGTATDLNISSWTSTGFFLVSLSYIV